MEVRYYLLWAVWILRDWRRTEGVLPSPKNFVAYRFHINVIQGSVSRTCRKKRVWASQAI